MKRTAVILMAGLMAAVAGYCAFYYGGTREHRELMDGPKPELAWLKKEFQLAGAEFERITQLHEGYMPRCEELCQRIAARNSELQELIGAPTVDTKAVEGKLEQIGNLWVECQKNMFGHFLEVSRQMPAEQGRRYLQWVQQHTLTPASGMARRHETGQSTAH
jgi:hypothetical protein